jgi:prevent-host-death family protein
MPLQIYFDVSLRVRYNVQEKTTFSEGAPMQRLKIDQDIRSMSEFRTGIASFLKQVHDTKRPMVITQHGKSAAVLLDVGEYVAMQEKLELLQDVQVAVNQIENGEGIPHQEAKNMVLKRVS